MSVALLVLEGFLLSLAALWYMRRLITGVTTQRYSIFSVFLNIPGGFLRALATKSCQVRCQPIAFMHTEVVPPHDEAALYFPSD